MSRDRSRVTRRGRRAGAEGFTLIEVLVATAVVAAVSVALQRGFVSTRQALARAEAVTAAEVVARDILENRLAELAPGVGTLRGEDRGLAYAVTSEPLDLPFAASPPEPPRRAAAAARPAPPTPGPRPDAAEPDDDPPDHAGRWTPLRVTIRVQPASGPPLVVETVQVAPAPPR
jgi:prepilin-type N-terminal cleavage/methylation domain-containing protein